MKLRTVEEIEARNAILGIDNERDPDDEPRTTRQRKSCCNPDISETERGPWLPPVT